MREPVVRAPRRIGVRAWWTVAVVVLIAIAGCAEAAGGQDPAGGDDLAGRTFLSEEVREHGEPRELVAGTRVSLDFTGDGQVVAQAGCNILFADVVVGDVRLEVSGVGGTEMGCDPARHQQDEWLAGFLERHPAWRLVGDRLLLTAGMTELALVDREVADPDRPLALTRWVVDGIVTGDGPDGAVSSMVAGTEGSAWLVVDGETFEASTGCRDLSGRVAVLDGVLRFSDVVQTDPACPPELAHVDEVVLAVLTGDVTYSIQAARLTLSHPDGYGLILLADS